MYSIVHGYLRIVVVYKIIYRRRRGVDQKIRGLEKMKKYSGDEISKFRLIYGRYGPYRLNSRYI